MHAAQLHRSPRLQRILRVLSDGAAYSTRDLIERAQVCAVNSAVAELRDNGIEVFCRREGRIFYYQIGAARRPRKGVQP